LHLAYLACKGIRVANSRGPGVDVFFDWELDSDRGGAEDWAPFKAVPSFLLSFLAISDL